MQRHKVWSSICTSMRLSIGVSAVAIHALTTPCEQIIRVRVVEEAVPFALAERHLTWECAASGQC